MVYFLMWSIAYYLGVLTAMLSALYSALEYVVVDMRKQLCARIIFHKWVIYFLECCPTSVFLFCCPNKTDLLSENDLQQDTFSFESK